MVRSLATQPAGATPLSGILRSLPATATTTRALAIVRSAKTQPVTTTPPTGLTRSLITRAVATTPRWVFPQVRISPLAATTSILATRALLANLGRFASARPEHRQEPLSRGSTEQQLQAQPLR